MSSSLSLAMLGGAVAVYLLFLPLLAQVAKAEDVFYDFVLEPIVENDLSPDCQNLVSQGRWLFLANRSIPGPTIVATEGDVIHVTVTNNHNSAGASIHWHGIDQIGTPFSDGIVQITQCPLGPLQSQEYTFVAEPSGTFFWHSHMSLHVADGLAGPLIVLPKEPEPFAYNEERTVFLQDFFTQTGTQQRIGLDSYPFVWIGNPTSLLINGKGIAPACDVGGPHVDDASLCLDTCNNTLSRLSNVTITSDRTYRLRIIGGSTLVMQNIAITNHTMTIVEVDGTIVEPVEVTNLNVAPGQRYSVLVTANQPPDSYWIETTVMGRDLPRLTGRAILYYDDSTSPIRVPTVLPSHLAWNDTAAGIALVDQLLTQNVSQYPQAPALPVPDSDVLRYVLVSTQSNVLDDEGQPIRLGYAVNNISNIFPIEPLLGTAVQVSRALGWPAELPGTIDMPQNPPTDWNYTLPLTLPGGPGPNSRTSGTSVIRVNQGQVLEIVLQNSIALNGVAEFHPWHAHGYSFWVVGRGEGNYNATEDVPTYNLDNPLLLDTVVLWPKGWVALRFLADNPGVWFMHCHINSHDMMGMSFSIVVQPDMVLGDPSQSVQFCTDTSLLPINETTTTMTPTDVTPPPTTAPSLPTSSSSSLFVVSRMATCTAAAWVLAAGAAVVVSILV